MRDKLLFLLLISGTLGAIPQESPLLQEMRLALDQAGRQLHSQQVEITLFHERIQSLEKSFDSLKQQQKNSPSEKLVEKRLSKLEKSQEALLTDLKTLKKHSNETYEALGACQVQLSKIDEQLSSDIKTLKTSLHSMLALLQPNATPEGERAYTVQPGDSLGQIAIDHKTDIKTLKKLNNLSTDIIYSGQKLLLP